MEKMYHQKPSLINRPLQAQATVDVALEHLLMSELQADAINYFWAIRITLERLSLSHNHLSAVPRIIASCQRLRYVNLYSNNFVTIPESVLDLPQLQISDISHSLLTEIPGAILKVRNTLTTLVVAKNKISRLPYALHSMDKLKILRYDGNPIIFPCALVLETHARMAQESAPQADPNGSAEDKQILEYHRIQNLKNWLASPNIYAVA